VAIEVISASMMTSNVTAHSARCVGDDRWEVSWLPGRILTGEQAVTAMTIASTVATHEVGAGDPEWATLDDWAVELDLTAGDVVAMVAQGCKPLCGSPEDSPAAHVSSDSMAGGRRRAV
jgi:hypothetical protein